MVVVTNEFSFAFADYALTILRIKDIFVFFFRKAVKILEAIASIHRKPTFVVLPMPWFFIS